MKGSDRASNLAAAETSGTDVNMAGRTVNNGFHTFDVRLPRTVAASMGVAHLDTESYTLFAKFTLSHLLHLLICLSKALIALALVGL